MNEQKTQTKTNTVVEQDLALKVYIDSLLFEDLLPDTEVAQEQLVAPVSKPVVAEAPLQAPVETQALVEPVVEVQAEPSLATEVAAEIAPPQAEVAVVEAPVAQTVEVPQTVAHKEVPAEPVSPVPEWAAGEFENLVFQVAGFLKLGVPLAKLNGIVNWTDDITHVPGHADWFIGLVSSRGRQVKVIDLARFVIPKNHKARASLKERPKFKHIVLVGDGEWGLACDDVSDVLKTTADKVKWRESRADSRPWLAGTVIEEMFALLDVDSFVSALKEGANMDEITN